MGTRIDPDSIIQQLIVCALACCASFEVDSSSRRRKDSTAAAKRSGKWSGNKAPYGFRTEEIDGQTLCIVNEFEREVLNACYRCWMAGWSLYELCLVLDRKGVKRNNKPWGTRQLQRAIQSLHEERNRRIRGTA